MWFSQLLSQSGLGGGGTGSRTIVFGHVVSASVHDDEEASSSSSQTFVGVCSCRNRQVEFLRVPPPSWRGSRSANCVSHLLIKNIPTGRLQTPFNPSRSPPRTPPQQENRSDPPPASIIGSQQNPLCQQSFITVALIALVPFGKAPSM